MFSDHDFSAEEIAEINGAFSQIEPVAKPRYYIRLSAETLPAWLILALGFVGGAIASGFFGSIGTDAYNKAKEIVKRIVKTKNDPTITFEMNYKGVQIKINSKSKDEATIERVFETINEAKDLAVNEIDSPATPSFTKLFITFDGNSWSLHEALDYKTARFPIIYNYNKESKKWERYR